MVTLSWDKDGTASVIFEKGSQAGFDFKSRDDIDKYEKSR